MKSAYELAMERFGDDEPSPQLTDAQKAELADLDRTYDAKVAEKEIFLQPKIVVARGEERTQLATQLRYERERLNEERERKKEAVRTRTRG